MHILFYLYSFDFFLFFGLETNKTTNQKSQWPSWYFFSFKPSFNTGQPTSTKKGKVIHSHVVECLRDDKWEQHKKKERKKERKKEINRRK